MALNYAAAWGSFEMDADHDGIGDGWTLVTGKNLGESGIDYQIQLDNRVVFRGGGSQKIEVFRRGTGAAADLYLLSPRIYPLSPSYPQPGDSLSVEVAFQDTGRVQVSYAFYLILRREGKDTAITLFESPSLPQKGWQYVKKSIRLSQNFQALQVALRIRMNAGPVRGTVWMDEVLLTTGKRLPPPLAKPFRLVRFFPSDFAADWIKDLQTFDIFVVQDPLFGARIKTINPATPVYLYANPWLSVVHTQKGPNVVMGRYGDFFPFDWANQKRPECFLENRSGQRIVFEENDIQYYLMNLGENVCLDRVSLNISKYLETAFRRNTQWMVDGILGIYLGEFLSQAPSKAQKGVSEFIAQWKKTQRGKILGQIRGRSVIHKAVREVLPDLDMPVLDAFVISKDGNILPPGVVETQFEVASDRPTVVRISWPKDSATQAYVVDALYMVVHPDLYVNFSGWERTPLDYHVLPSLKRPYGDPLKPFKVYKKEKDEGSLLVREFTNGILLFNTSGIHSFVYRLKNPHEHPQKGVLPKKTELEIPPHTSVFLRRAY